MICTVSVVVVTLSLSLGLQESIPESGESADHVNHLGKMPILSSNVGIRAFPAKKISASLFACSLLFVYVFKT